MKRIEFMFVCSVASMFVAGVLVCAQDKKEAAEQERQIKEAEVPAVAMATLKKLAGVAAITAFAEEIEHGHKFYEGSWKAADGNVDALVTDLGDLVEIEEEIPAAKVPAPARAAAEKEAGKDAKMIWEKKTIVMYEVHYKKGDKGQEMTLTPDGRQYHEEGAEKGGKNEDEDEENK